MKLSKGSQRLFDFLRQRRAGDVVEKTHLERELKWGGATLRTYISKHKLDPFLHDEGDGTLRVIMDGSDVTKGYLHEVFTQKSPPALTLSRGDLFDGDESTYRLVRPVGQGAIGSVWSARDAHDESVALKVMTPRKDLLAESQLPNVRERFRREAENGRLIDHPNVVRYIDHGDKEGNPFLAMELASGSVAQMLRDGPLSYDQSAKVMSACVDGLSCIHEKGAPHRDIKPANLLVFRDGVYKLGDLGIVKWSDFDDTFIRGGTITRDSVQLGSWFYMAPEQQESPHEASPASDLYALGVTWIEMLTGKPISPQAVGARAYSLPSSVPSRAVELIERMVEYHPSRRPSLDDIRTVLA